MVLYIITDIKLLFVLQRKSFSRVAKQRVRGPMVHMPKATKLDCRCYQNRTSAISVTAKVGLALLPKIVVCLVPEKVGGQIRTVYICMLCDILKRKLSNYKFKLK